MAMPFRNESAHGTMAGTSAPTQRLSAAWKLWYGWNDGKRPLRDLRCMNTPCTIVPARPAMTDLQIQDLTIIFAGKGCRPVVHKGYVSRTASSGQE